MEQITIKKLKFYPLGGCNFEINSLIGTSSVTKFQFDTIHDSKWKFEINNSSDKLVFNVFENGKTSEFHTIETQYGLILENLLSKKHNITFEGTHVFSKENGKLSLEIPDIAKINDTKSGFYDPKDDFPKLKFIFQIWVKSSRLCDMVTQIDMSDFDPLIHDANVDVLGIKLCVLNKLIALQSPKLAKAIKEGVIKTDQLPENCNAHHFASFLQIIHGVDLNLDEQTFYMVLQLATMFDVPRVLEYCKSQLITGCGEMSANARVKKADELKAHEVAPAILSTANSLLQLKNQNWNLDVIPENVVQLIANRVFELNC